ncbi:hypothetical protein C7S18_17815 [Ahniella affigens]|uniref:Glycoside hydrolase family 44 catalytic domain-containing protein n=1 Tax=Ahniella affigens TaxID=2021234 RepID=A0A2P1PVP4_9GAMM|nr:glycoside hydrolase family 44 protein [Ahniella affigens]AVP98921.1 hypothetical protein C7S18_17815 [Ahniella affigens]
MKPHTAARLFLALLLGAPMAQPAQAQDVAVFADSLNAGFQNWSWATVNLNVQAPNPVYAGTRSASMEPDSFQGLYFHANAPLNTAGYTELRFAVHGGGTGGQNVNLVLQNGSTIIYNQPLAGLVTGGSIAASQWREVVLPFSGPGAPSGSFDGIIVQDQSGGNQGVLYLDEMRLTAGVVVPTAVTITVDPGGTRRAINPEIYGVNFGSDSQHADLHYPTRRWGGNRTSRYNWQFDVDNTANDYFFQNIAAGDGSNLPNNATANQFVVATKAQGGEPLITVPTLGFVAKDSRVKLWSFSQATYGAQTLDECRYYGPNPPFWCTADSGNGLCTNGPFCVGGKIVGNNPLDTSKAAPASYAADWVTHLRARHGTAANGGVKYFALDNEPMLWDSTHRDVHPAAPTYDEVWQRGRDRAIAIKQVEPDAKIFGPVTWGWCDYWTSASDAALGNCFEGPDRTNHGGLPFVEWYLERACTELGPGNVRLIDFLDLHYYPQADHVAATNDADPAAENPDVQAIRLRSLRELYDPAYVSESWIGGTAYPTPNLLRRAKSAIDARCPGIKLAVTEYKWGPDNGVSGALAQAELLAIFGREGVDYATRWIAPADNSLAEHAFRMFLDYDGALSRVVGDSIPATSTATNDVGAYAIDQNNGPLFILVFNRDTLSKDLTLNLNGLNATTYSLYRLSAAGYQTVSNNTEIAGSSVNFPSFPARTANLFVIQRNAVGNLLFANGFE